MTTPDEYGPTFEFKDNLCSNKTPDDLVLGNPVSDGRGIVWEPGTFMTGPQGPRGTIPSYLTGEKGIKGIQGEPLVKPAKLRPLRVVESDFQRGKRLGSSPLAPLIFVGFICIVLAILYV